MYGTPQAPTYNADPVEDESESPESYNDKRQVTGFYIGKPPVFTKAVGVPDIWDMFSQEWGQKLGRRMGNNSK